MRISGGLRQSLDARNVCGSRLKPTWRPEHPTRRPRRGRCVVGYAMGTRQVFQRLLQWLRARLGLRWRLRLTMARGFYGGWDGTAPT